MQSDWMEASDFQNFLRLYWLWTLERGREHHLAWTWNKQLHGMRGYNLVLKELKKKKMIAFPTQPFVGLVRNHWKVILPNGPPVSPDNHQGQNPPDHSPCHHSPYWLCFLLTKYLLIQDYPWIDNYEGKHRGVVMEFGPRLTCHQCTSGLIGGSHRHI